MRKNSFRFFISKVYFFFSFMFFCCYSFCQSIPDSVYVDLSKITTYEPIRNKTEVAFLSPDSALDKSYGTLQFQSGSLFRKDMPAKFVNRKLILRFHIANSTGVTDSTWFFPGFFYYDIHLYRVSGNSLTKIPNIEPNFPDSMGYRLLDLPPGDSATFLAELRPVKTYINNIRPRIIRKSHLSTFIFDLSSAHLYLNIITYIF